MRLGLLGGTFDPPHAGHLAAARWARDQCRLDRVELMPACRPPHKPDRPLSSPFDRYAMTVLATLGEERLAASYRELARGGTSYAVETLREVRTSFPESRIFFILGTDQFAELATWREPRALVEEFELIVVTRPGAALGTAPLVQPEWVGAAVRSGRVVVAPMEPVDISSTTIRDLAGAGESISGLVTPQVAQYIDRYGLYRSGG